MVRSLWYQKLSVSKMIGKNSSPWKNVLHWQYYKNFAKIAALAMKDVVTKELYAQKRYCK